MPSNLLYKEPESCEQLPYPVLSVSPKMEGMSDTEEAYAEVIIKEEEDIDTNSTDDALDLNRFCHVNVEEKNEQIDASETCSSNMPSQSRTVIASASANSVDGISVPSSENS